MSGIFEDLMALPGAVMACDFDAFLQDADGGGRGEQGQGASHCRRGNGVVIQIKTNIDGFSGMNGEQAIGFQGVRGQRKQTWLWTAPQN